jgi:hypothetical protein
VGREGGRRGDSASPPPFPKKKFIRWKKKKIKTIRQKIKI